MSRIYVDKYTGRIERTDMYLVRLTLKDGTVYEDLEPRMLFPYTNHTMFITLLDSDERELGFVRDLRLQVDFTLQEGYTTPEGKRIRAIRYKADFVYKTMGKGGFSGSTTDDEFWRTLPADSTVIEDAKGKRTDVYSIKEKMMKNKGFTIREV